MSWWKFGPGWIARFTAYFASYPRDKAEVASSDAESMEEFVRACAEWTRENPDKAKPFLQALISLLQDCSQAFRRQLDTSHPDPFRNLRVRARLFCKRWGVKWPR